MKYVQSDVIVTVCPAVLRRQAHRLLFSHSPPYPESSPPAEPPPIIVALRGDELLGAVEYQLGVGRVGWVGVSRVTGAGLRLGNFRVTPLLLQAAVEQLRGDGVRVVQMIVDRSDDRTGAIEQSGFRRITDIVDMERATELSGGPWSGSDGAAFEFVPYRDMLWHELCRVVRETYEGSADCPELDGLRPVPEVLAGYRAAGDFRDEYWSMVRCGHAFVGCVLQAVVPESDVSVLQYMGVVRGSRRRGVGRGLVRHGLEVAQRAGVQAMRLAVDVRNDAAQHLYTQMGFVEQGRRTVFLIHTDGAEATR